MEVLIELVVWIFRAIFGDPDEEKRKQQRDITRPTITGSPSAVKRGPLNYGDDSRRPKTLEEILEEVRREATGKKPQAPPAIVEEQAPQPRAERRTLESTLSPQSTDTSSTVETIQPIVEAPRYEAPRYEAPAAPLWPAPAEATPKRKKNQPRTEVTVAISAREAAAVLATANKEKKKDKADRQDARQAAADVAANQITANFEVMRALRLAPAETKRAAARQAMVMLEVFGPPRSRRPHGRQERSF